MMDYKCYRLCSINWSYFSTYASKFVQEILLILINDIVNISNTTNSIKTKLDSLSNHAQKIRQTLILQSEFGAAINLCVMSTTDAVI